MQTVLRILKSAGGWHPGLSLTVKHPPYLELAVEALDEPGPCGLPALSVAHYGEQDMRDPEMYFELSFAGGEADLNPFYYRNDSVGCERWSRFLWDTVYVFDRELYQQHLSFARVWDRNLQSQGFAEAFERQQQQSA